MLIGLNASWSDNAPKGWTYKDKYGAAAGVNKVRIQTGADGDASVQIKATGQNLPLPAPFSESKFFDENPRVTIQLFNDATPTCWTSEFTGVGGNDGERFNVKAP
jgi:hypothetical protein